jgi:hypothetical protein
MKKMPKWLEDRYSIDSETECWLWEGARFSTGYALVTFPGQEGPVGAHRAVHEALIGPIPAGYHVDHVYSRGCRHRHCVNPSHLEAVTPQENTRRYHATKGLCRNGHPKKNLYVTPDGRNNCRECRRESHKRWVAANPERYRELVNKSQRRIRAERKAGNA